MEVGFSGLNTRHEANHSCLIKKGESKPDSDLRAGTPLTPPVFSAALCMPLVSGALGLFVVYFPFEVTY
jgi:hypothetical protein